MTGEKKKKIKLKKDDEVIVIAGREKGKRGKIMFIDREGERVVVQGINRIKRYQRPSQENPQGGVLEIESPLHYSNVMLYDSRTKKGVRLGVERGRDGVRTRVARPGGKEV